MSIEDAEDPFDRLLKEAKIGSTSNEDYIEQVLDGIADSIADAPPGPMPSYLQTGAVEFEPATPDSLVCLRGPCRHYGEMVTKLAHGNVPGSLPEGFKGRLRNRFCTKFDQDLTDGTVYECNAWDPIVPELEVEYEARATRRAHYSQQKNTNGEGD